MKPCFDLLIYQLESLASIDKGDIEGDDFEVGYEDLSGREGFANESVTEVADKAAKALDCLQEAIRRGADQNELLRIIGPTMDERADSARRQQEMDAIEDRYRGLEWPPEAHQKHDALLAQQDVFEARYANCSR